MPPHLPLASVVTPVYNGGKFLEKCIESVLAQSYGNFEYVILDNASTDGTGKIAERYAQRDRRIRLLRNDHTLPVIENWNRAVAEIAGESRYLKILHADDTLYTDCLTKMIRLAEAHPAVGIVGSLRLRGNFIECKGLPTDREIFSGKEVARRFLTQESFVFAPTSGLVRSDLVRARQPFYPTQYLHADLAAYLDLLAITDFGFLHEVLTFSRTHEDSITTTVAERKQTLLREWLGLLQDYGPHYFSADDLVRVERAFLRRYHRLLVRSLFTRRSREFLHYHLAGLRAAQRTPTATDLAIAVGAELAASVMNPGRFFRNLRGSLVHRQP